MANNGSPKQERKRKHREPHPDAEKVLGGRLYRVEEVAQLLQIGETEVRKLINNGELIAARIAGSYRIAETAIRAYVEARNEEASEAALVKRQERQRQRELERRQQRDPAMRWAYAQCIWCGVEPTLCTRNDRLVGEIRCESCEQEDENARQRGGFFTRTKDLVERSVAIMVRERDQQAEEELGTFERNDRDALIAHLVKVAQRGPLINFGPEKTTATRARMVELAQQRPAHWLTFRCALCDRPQAVSRRSLFDIHSFPSCTHREPFKPADKYLAQVLEVEKEEAEANFAGLPTPDSRLKLMFHPDNVWAFAELEASERNIELGADPDPDMGDAVWEVCRCAHCGEHQAVAKRSQRSIGQTTCRLCVRNSKAISPIERAHVIMDLLRVHDPEAMVRPSKCSCGGFDVLITIVEGDVGEPTKLTWCTDLTERERIKYARAWVEHFGLSQEVSAHLCTSVRDSTVTPGARAHRADDQGDLEDIPF